MTGKAVDKLDFFRYICDLIISEKQTFRILGFNEIKKFWGII
jgi:hypothetical protein